MCIQCILHAHDICTISVAESADSTSNFTTIKEFDNSAKPVQRKIKPRRKSSQLCLPFPQMLDDGKPFHFVRVWKGPNASCGEKRVHIHQIKTRSSAKYRRSQNETNDIERNNTSTKWLQSKHSSTTSSQECGKMISIYMCTCFFFIARKYRDSIDHPTACNATDSAFYSYNAYGFPPGNACMFS